MTRLLHLAYLDPHAVPDDCPEALQILYTVDALGEAGVDVTLVTPRPRGAVTPCSILGREPSARVRLEHLPDLRRRWWWPGGSSKPFYWLAGRRLRRLKVDAVLTRNLKLAEHLLRHTPQVPLFFETHELFAQSFRDEHPKPSARARRKLAALEARELYVYRNARGLIALTPLLIEDIRRVYGIGTPAIVAPDGVDLRQAEPRQFSAPNPRPVLLYLGSLHPWKGVHTIIRALAYVTHDVRLEIVGGNGERIAELQALAQGLGVGDRVIFVGHVAPGRRFDYIHRADVCLLPLTPTSIASRYTSPLKLFEYMAAGKAIVVSDLPSMRTVLEPGNHALLVPASQPQAFAEAIDTLLSDRSMLHRLGENARRHAAAFSWSRRAATLADFVASLVTAQHHVCGALP